MRKNQYRYQICCQLEAILLNVNYKYYNVEKYKFRCLTPVANMSCIFSTTKCTTILQNYKNAFHWQRMNGEAGKKHQPQQRPQYTQSFSKSTKEVLNLLRAKQSYVIPCDPQSNYMHSSHSVSRLGALWVQTCGLFPVTRGTQNLTTTQLVFFNTRKLANIIKSSIKRAGYPTFYQLVDHSYFHNVLKISKTCKRDVNVE